MFTFLIALIVLFYCYSRGTVQNMKHLQKKQVSYFMHFLRLYTFKELTRLEGYTGCS